MPWGNYRKTPCDQCGTSFWTSTAALGSGTRNLCRSCSRDSSSGVSSLTAAAALGPAVSSRTSVREQMLQAQRFHSFQRAASTRQTHMQRMTARAQPSETGVASLSRRLRELQFRELTPEDYEVLQQLDEAVRQQRAHEEGTGSSGSVSSLFDPNGAGPAAANSWQSRSNGQWRLQPASIRPNALLPAPESGDWKGEDCAICLDCLKESETVCALPRCGHAFHRTCIEGWLTRGRPACPLDAIEVDL